MIHPRELRVGNFVRCLAHLPIGFNTPPFTFSKIKEIREDQIETSGGFNRFREVSPLPLTEEILLKNGGEKVSDNLIKFSDPDLPDLFLVKDEGKFYLSGSDEKKYSVSLDAIHDFQNLYFVIKGRDLRMCL